MPPLPAAGRYEGGDEVAALVAGESEDGESEDQPGGGKTLELAGGVVGFRAPNGQPESDKTQEAPGKKTAQVIGGRQHEA